MIFNILIVAVVVLTAIGIIFGYHFYRSYSSMGEAFLHNRTAITVFIYAYAAALCGLGIMFIW